MTEVNTPTQIRRPKKWDHAFSADMAPEQVDALLKREPFASMIPPAPESGADDAKAEKRETKSEGGGSAQDILSMIRSRQNQ
jgi:hypothetical protein